MEGFLQGRPGILWLYSPSDLLKMSIKLSQQDDLYYSMTDTFTVDTNPCSQYSPFVGSAFTDIPPEPHLIDNNDSSGCSEDYDKDVTPVDCAPVDNDPATAIPTNTDANVIPPCRSRINVNLAPAQPHVQTAQPRVQTPMLMRS